MRSVFTLSLILILASLCSAFTSTHSSKKTRSLLGSKRNVKPSFLAATADGAAPEKKVKKATKKKAVKKKKAAVKHDVEEVVTVRKPEFVSKIAEKTGMSKSDSEAALSAVLETITEVS